MYLEYLEYPESTALLWSAKPEEREQARNQKRFYRGCGILWLEICGNRK